MRNILKPDDLPKSNKSSGPDVIMAHDWMPKDNSFGNRLCRNCGAVMRLQLKNKPCRGHK